MSSSTKGSIAASATALLAITTPFVQPTDCNTQWKTASESLRVLDGTTLRTLLVVSEPAATCYPSGWDDVPPESHLSFSPGVCPEGWTYNQMGENGSQAATTAFCCDRFVAPICTESWESSPADFTPSGFTYAWTAGRSRGKSQCARWGWNTGTGVDLEAQTPSNEVTMVHEPWAVTWAGSDTTTLTPKLPTITSSMTVPTWTPGETIPDGRWDADKNTSQDNGVQYDGSFLAIIIGLPIFGVLVLSCFIGCCVRACYKRRRETRVVYVLDPTIPVAYEMNVRVRN